MLLSHNLWCIPSQLIRTHCREITTLLDAIWNDKWWLPTQVNLAIYYGEKTAMCNISDVHCEGILPKKPYLPCISMAGRALLAGYPRLVHGWWEDWINIREPFILRVATNDLTMMLNSMWCHMAKWINPVSGNSLLPDKPLPEPMLTYDQ